MDHFLIISFFLIVRGFSKTNLLESCSFRMDSFSLISFLTTPLKYISAYLRMPLRMDDSTLIELFLAHRFYSRSGVYTAGSIWEVLTFSPCYLE